MRKTVFSFRRVQLHAIVVALFIIIAATSQQPMLAQRNRPALPSVLCALVNAQVVCYDTQKALPYVVSQSTSDQRVLDFTIAPDQSWVAYRTNTTIWAAQINGSGIAYPIDTAAALPADISLLASTLAWSPDGLSIGYVTAAGFRVAFPPEADIPQFVEQTDRPYINLRFSATGLRLAAQSSDGSWQIFAVDTVRHTILPTRTIEQPGDLAWFDDGSFVVAYLSGGLARYASDTPAQGPQWTVPDQHYIKLISSSTGDVYAINPDPGDTIGSSVSIRPDGTVTRLGDSKIDSRVRWGPDGRVMYYIASGVPILVDRVTGAEDMLPVKGISRLLWAAPISSLDAASSDPFYIQADSAGIRQVWQRPNISGLRPQQITNELTSHVDDYAISADQLTIAYSSAGRLIAMPLDNPDKQVTLATLPRTSNARTNSGGVFSWPAWNPNGQEIAYASSDSVFTVNYVPFVEGATENPTVSTLLKQAENGLSYHPVAYSPDGEWLLLKVIGANDKCSFLAIQPSTQQEQSIDSCPESIVWGKDNSLLMVLNSAAQRRSIDGTLSKPLTDWPVVGAYFDKDGTTTVLLRRIGWEHGPIVVQQYHLDANGNAVTDGRPRLQPLLQPQH
jgi:hypothetical protein